VACTAALAFKGWVAGASGRLSGRERVSSAQTRCRTRARSAAASAGFLRSGQRDNSCAKHGSGPTRLRTVGMEWRSEGVASRACGLPA
jgi:hypothetical protein